MGYVRLSRVKGSEIRGPLFGSSYSKGYRIWGSTLGSPHVTSCLEISQSLTPTMQDPRFSDD